MVGVIFLSTRDLDIIGGRTVKLIEKIVLSFKEFHPIVFSTNNFVMEDVILRFLKH